MDESIVKVLERQQVGKPKMSAAIRVGAELIEESRDVYLSDRRGCVLGAAAVAVGVCYIGPHTFFSALRDTFGVSEALLEEISDLHHNGGMNRAQIADRLEAQGL